MHPNSGWTDSVTEHPERKSAAVSHRRCDLLLSAKSTVRWFSGRQQIETTDYRPDRFRVLSPTGSGDLSGREKAPGERPPNGRTLSFPPKTGMSRKALVARTTRLSSSTLATDTIMS